MQTLHSHCRLLSKQNADFQKYFEDFQGINSQYYFYYLKLRLYCNECSADGIYLTLAQINHPSIEQGYVICIDQGK